MQKLIPKIIRTGKALVSNGRFVDACYYNQVIYLADGKKNHMFICFLHELVHHAIYLLYNNSDKLHKWFDKNWKMTISKLEYFFKIR